jgi:hypothetical protein
LKEFAKDLSEPSLLRHKYLNTSWIETMKQEYKVRTSFLSRDDLSQNLEGNRSNHVTNIKIKIIILENSGYSRFKRECVKFLSPLMYSLNGMNSSEFCYSALLIGPWLLTWNENSLCIPKRCSSAHALLSADINSIYTIRNLEETLTELAKTITHWNAAKQYRNNFPTNESDKYGNSQHFVEAILASIGVKMQVGTYLEEFLKTIREKGSSELYICPSQEMRKQFDVKEKHVFPTHLALDEFVKKLLFVDTNFANNYSREWDYLKSIDRAFWMKYLEERSETNKPIMNGVDRTDCPFGDPLLTNSFIL